MADRRPRGLDVTLRQSKQRKAGLRAASPLVGLSVRLLRLRELTAQPVELGGSGERHPDGRLTRRPGEPLARPLGFVHGVLPLAVELHELGAVHEALTAVRDQLGLRREPVAQGRRPLLRAAQIEDLLAGLDHAAVDRSREDRRDLARDDGHHHLVELRDAFRDLPERDAGLPPAVPRQRDQVRVAEPFADLGRLLEARIRARHVAFGKALHRGWQEQIPALNAVVSAVVEESGGPGQPAAAPGHLATVHQAERQPQRANERLAARGPDS